MPSSTIASAAPPSCRKTINAREPMAGCRRCPESGVYRSHSQKIASGPPISENFSLHKPCNRIDIFLHFDAFERCSKDPFSWHVLNLFHWFSIGCKNINKACHTPHLQVRTLQRAPFFPYTYKEKRFGSDISSCAYLMTALTKRRHACDPI
jgi:hypothetical protein